MPSSTADQNYGATVAPKMEQQIRNDEQRITSSTDEEDSDAFMPINEAEPKPTVNNHILDDCTSGDGSFDTGKVRFLRQPGESNQHVENVHKIEENVHISSHNA